MGSRAAGGLEALTMAHIRERRVHGGSPMYTLLYSEAASTTTSISPAAR